MNESVEIEKESFSLAFLSPHHHVHVLHDAVFDVFCLSVKEFLELNKNCARCTHVVSESKSDAFQQHKVEGK